MVRNEKGKRKKGRRAPAIGGCGTQEAGAGLAGAVKSAPRGGQNSTFLSRPRNKPSTPFDMQQI
jgi:hypothetical protein